MDDLISVVVPVYNVEKYLCRCIDSIVYQTYKKLEIILVDDGSTDDSGNICDFYSKQDKRIKVIHKKNGGLSDARNTGIKKAKGKYITFIDSDDFINKHYISILYNNLIKYNADISCCNFKIFNNKLPRYDIIQRKEKLVNLFNSEDAINNMFYEKQINNSASCKIYKTSLFKNIFYPLDIYFEDMATTYRIFQKAKIITFIDDGLYYYYQRNDSILHQINMKKLNDLKYVISYINDDLGATDKYKKSILARTINAYFYIYRNVKDAEIKKESKNFILNNRRKVLLDKKISKKTKIGLILSYISFDLVNLIFKTKEYIKIKNI